MYLNVHAEINGWNGKKTECYLKFVENPITKFAHLPKNLKGLEFSSMINGIICGALEAVCDI